jgi:hypothetical protein
VFCCLLLLRRFVRFRILMFLHLLKVFFDFELAQLMLLVLNCCCSWCLQNLEEDQSLSFSHYHFLLHDPINLIHNVFC